MSSVQIDITRELQNAERARREGNEGRARVCARRAAGIAARDFLARKGISLRNKSAYSALLALAGYTELAPDLHAITLHLTTKVTEEFVLPVDVDLIAEARKLIGGLA
jgi:hypothetical protein